MNITDVIEDLFKNIDKEESRLKLLDYFSDLCFKLENNQLTLEQKSNLAMWTLVNKLLPVSLEEFPYPGLKEQFAELVRLCDLEFKWKIKE